MLLTPAETVSKQLFLSTHNIIKQAVKDGDKPGWETSYNFASLLNLPHTLKGIGPLVDLLEGMFQGEGIIASTKNMLSNGL